jgi:hypothetical protein
MRVPLPKGDEARIGFIFYDWRVPYLILHRYGPNGSPAGFGPKGWRFNLRFSRRWAEQPHSHRVKIALAWDGTIPLPLPNWHEHRRTNQALTRFYRWLDRR